MTIDDFQRMIVASGLVGEADAAVVRSQLTCTSLQAFGDLFVAKHLITPWQRRQLLQGRYKGFFVDDEFKLLEYLGCVSDRNRYLAESTVFRERVILSIEFPITGKPFVYDVEKLSPQQD